MAASHQRQEEFDLDGIPVKVTRKRVRRTTLRVTPEGDVRVSAPYGQPLASITAFAESKKAWIRQARAQALAERGREAELWQDGSTVFLWGRPLTLRIEAPGARGKAEDGAPAPTPGSSRAATPTAGSIRLAGSELFLALDTAGLGAEESRDLVRGHVEAWLRGELERALPQVLAECEATVGRHASRIRLRHMKTRWGSCNVRTASITLNTELAERPKGCLYGVVTHELCHLIEPSHDARFHALMDRFYPDWRSWRKVLNAVPPRRDE